VRNASRAVLVVLLAACAGPGGRRAEAWRDPSRPPGARAADLLSRMTLEEKAAQLRCSLSDPEEKPVIPAEGIGNLGTFLRPFPAAEAAEKANRVQRIAREKTRLGIPILVHDEALHGLVGKGAASFPQAIALAATFDPDLMLEVATAIGRETRSRGIHQALSPVVNLARDVRWGRVEETYGEDPHLSARMGVAFCRGLEGAGVITTPKHFAVNVGDGGRDSQAIDLPERLLRETEFVPFEACFREAGAGSVMAAYNSLNGLPCSSNPWLLTDILRKEWGFRGFVVSDYDSVGGIVSLHRAAASKKEGAARALGAGLDVELPRVDLYGPPLLEALREGLVPREALDRAVSRVLEAKFRLGLFEDASVDPGPAAALADCAEHRALARRAAREAIVLLRNEGDLLPLRKDLGAIAVIGPLADEVRLGGYSGSGMKTVSALEGIRAKVSPGTKVLHARGCEMASALPAIPPEFLRPEGGDPQARGMRGEYFGNRDLEGNAALVRTDERVDFDWSGGSPGEGVKADDFSVRWTGRIVPPETRAYEISVTTDDGVRLWIDGRLLADSWTERSPTTDRVSVRWTAGEPHDLRLEYYERGGGAVARLGWDWRSGALLEEAVEAAKASDAAVVLAGIEEGEGRDRASLDLSPAQEELILSVASVGKPLVVVLVGGSAVTMARWIGQAPAILEAWYGGEEGGSALAEILFGDVSPAGRLPITFPRSVGQLPLVYNHRPTGRGYDYVDLSGQPLFPFGHGLSYTRFEYSNLRIEPAEIPPAGRVEVRLDVRNAGGRAGDEVVQLYLRDEVGSVVRPVKELRGFRRIALAPGETRTVRFGLGPGDLAYPGPDMKPLVEPGIFRAMVGASSSDIRLEGEFRVAGSR
jgi:beta-glucosidase